MTDRKAHIDGKHAPVRRWILVYEVDIAPVIALHTTQRRLCHELEQCANHLPNRHAIIGAAAVTFALEASLREQCALPHTVLQNLLDIDATILGNMVLSRIRQHRAADRFHAEDLHDALTTAANEPRAIASDTLSYMMRCLFDNCRRGIDYEQMALLLLAGDRLTAAAYKTLIQSLSA